MARLATALAIVLLTPLLAGCASFEALEIALRVEPGDTVVVTGERYVNGSILVEPGGRLLVDGGRLTVAQSLIVQGELRADRAAIRFSGPFERQDLEVGGTAFLTSTDIAGVRHLVVADGTLRHVDGAVEASTVRVGGTLDAVGVDWHLAGRTRGWSAPSAFDVLHGDARLVNGTVTFSSEPGGFALAGGRLDLDNHTVTFGSNGQPALRLEAGAFEAWNTTFALPDRARFLQMSGAAAARFVDSPMPRNQDLPSISDDARLEVAWTLLVRAVALPGNIPVGGLNATLASAHAPAQTASHGVTDERGEARLVATQYVYAGAESRSGNPHAVHVSGGGKEGRMAGLVLEGPQTVVVPVFG